MRLVGVELFHVDGQIEGRQIVDANSRFLQFLRTRLKRNITCKNRIKSSEAQLAHVIVYGGIVVFNDILRQV